MNEAAQDSLAEASAAVRAILSNSSPSEALESLQESVEIAVANSRLDVLETALPVLELFPVCFAWLLVLAAESDRGEVVLWLLEQGADPRQRDSVTGKRFGETACEALLRLRDREALVAVFDALQTGPPGAPPPRHPPTVEDDLADNAATVWAIEKGFDEANERDPRHHQSEGHLFESRLDLTFFFVRRSRKWQSFTRLRAKADAARALGYDVREREKVMLPRSVAAGELFTLPPLKGPLLKRAVEFRLDFEKRACGAMTTKEAVAEKMGVNVRSLYRWFRETKPPPIEWQRAFSRTVGLPSIVLALEEAGIAQCDISGVWARYPLEGACDSEARNQSAKCA